jgi:hypothetical protein
MSMPMKARARAALLLTVTAALNACAGASQRGNAGVSMVNSADVTRDARLLQMSDLRQLDTTLVDELLDDRDSARRARAVLAIGQVKGQARYPQLRRLLVDADTAVAAMPRAACCCSRWVRVSGNHSLPARRRSDRRLSARHLLWRPANSVRRQLRFCCRGSPIPMSPWSGLPLTHLPARARAAVFVD